MSILSLKSASLGRVSVAQFNEDCTNSYDHSSSNTEIACEQFANVVHESN